jgi:hypothetical protein
MEVYSSEKRQTESMFKEAIELLKEKLAKCGPGIPPTEHQGRIEEPENRSVQVRSREVLC